MVISTQTLDRAAGLMTQEILQDKLDIYNVGEPATVGYEVTRSLTKTLSNVAGMVQTTTLQNAVESAVANTYSIKVGRGVSIQAGQAVKVVTCQQEPDLVGKTLLIDKVSQNGLALLRKCVASDFHQVDQQGKGDL